MRDLLNPEKALIFRITHRNNLPWILANGLHCRNSNRLDSEFVSICNADLIAQARPVFNGIGSRAAAAGQPKIPRCHPKPDLLYAAAAVAAREHVPYNPQLMHRGASEAPFRHRHLLGIEGLSPDDINHVLDLADGYVELNRQAEKKRGVLRGRTIINCFFENSTRTRTSFEVAGKRLGGDVINMSVSASSMVKGETLIDTAMTLNAMHPDVLVVRHPESGAVHLLSEKVDCAVVNAGDGSHEHPTQALLDALTIRRRKGRLGGLTVAICGDVLHSRVARSNIALLNTMGARVRVVAPRTLLPAEIERLGVEVFHDMAQGLAGVDIVMMLRLQSERMHGSFVPSTREYFHFFGLDYEKLRMAKPDALIMHPGPMNRGVEIGSEIADDIDRSLIRHQVEMGVAVRMACLEILTRDLGNGPPLP
jgi:aspartate carbamoyltransferase catalytic subunit